MKMRRTFTALGAMLLAGTVLTTAYSQPASATSSVYCDVNANGRTAGSTWWLECTSSNGAQATWYVNGVYQANYDGAEPFSYICKEGYVYTVSVNPGTPLAATWKGKCYSRTP